METSTHRRRPLETCGPSMLSIAGILRKKIENFNGPFASITRKMLNLTSLILPYLDFIKCQLLVIVSLTDDHVLALESYLEKMFPPSRQIFDKIDHLLGLVETSAGEFDHGMDKFPEVFNHVLLQDFVLACAISWLEFLVCVLTRWRNNNMKEKEIAIDKSFSGSEIFNQSEKIEDIDGSDTGEPKKATYKEVLERGSPKKVLIEEETYKDADAIWQEEKSGHGAQKTEADAVLQEGRSGDGEEETGSGEGEGIDEGDPIMELFEHRWILNPINGSSSSLNIPRSG